MPTLDFDFLVAINFKKSAGDLSTVDRDVLTKTVVGHRDPSVVIPVFSTPETLTESKKPDFPGLLDGYKVAEEKINDLLSIIDRRSDIADLVLDLDPEKDGVIIEALHRLYAGSPLKISYKMYRQLLEFQIKLGQELAEGSAFA